MNPLDSQCILHRFGTRRGRREAAASEPVRVLRLSMKDVDSTSVREPPRREHAGAKRVLVQETGEAMDHKNKFTAETVLELQQSLDHVPPYHATELSKQQTVRTLSPQIFALRAKGYSWTAVAAMLSERGLPISVAALRTYLRRVRDEAAKEKPRTQTKRLQNVRAESSPAQQPSADVRSPPQTGETPAARKPLELAAAVASAVAGPNVSATGTRREQEPRRSAFGVRPDLKDI